jgi:hypothetical protein
VGLVTDVTTLSPGAVSLVAYTTKSGER